jgi:Ca2+-binding RTX toxin-like protein
LWHAGAFPGIAESDKPRGSQFDKKELAMRITKSTNKLVMSILIGGLCLSPLSSEAISLGDTGAVIVCPYIPDTLSELPLCEGKEATCIGTDGHDLIWGTDASDVIYAGAGNDVIQADAGDDTVCAGEGDDSIHGARGQDRIFGEGGTDWVFGAMDDDYLSGGEGDFDVIWGGPGVDYLDGGPGVYDVCLKQREGAEVNLESCETIYPPIGYKHESEHEIGTGLIGPR